MKVYIDFDRTLFNVKSFLNDFYELLEEENIKKEDFLDYEKYNSANGFNPYNILSSMRKEHPFSDNLYLEIDRLIKNCVVYLYEDGVRFLKKLKDNNIEVILLTRGDYEYQSNKISNSKLKKYFSNIIVTNEHKGDLNLDYNSIFIDDNIEEIKSILNNNPYKVYLIDREKKYNNINNNKIEVIHSLGEIDI